MLGKMLVFFKWGGIKNNFYFENFYFHSCTCCLGWGYKLDKYTKYENVLSQSLDGVKKRIISYQCMWETMVQFN